jgi:ribosomal protein S18 acetylase RimI-like enzyme
VNVEVAPARVEDAPALAALHRAVLSEADWFITLPHEHFGGVDQKIRQIRDFSRAGNSVFLVARVDGRVVGYATVHGGSLTRMRHAGKLEVMVAADARGQGVGEALVRGCVAWAEAHPEIVKLGLSVFATNDRAVTLYRKLGFIVEGRREREYRMEDGSWRDDLLMYRWVGR